MKWPMFDLARPDGTERRHGFILTDLDLNIMSIDTSEFLWVRNNQNQRDFHVDRFFGRSICIEKFRNFPVRDCDGISGSLSSHISRFDPPFSVPYGSISFFVLWHPAQAKARFVTLEFRFAKRISGHERVSVVEFARTLCHPRKEAMSGDPDSNSICGRSETSIQIRGATIPRAWVSNSTLKSVKR
jgi:hypothetical protein